MERLAAIGMGLWGKNLIHEFSKISQIKYCYSLGDPKNKLWLQKTYPEIQFTNDLDIILNDKTIKAVFIAVPIKFHYEIVFKCLNSGKHVFIEKPLAETYLDGKKLSSLAKKNRLVLFVGHIFLYHPILEKIKKLITADPIVDISFSWEKFGSFKENILQDLVSHHFSIILEILESPKKISVMSTSGFFTNTDQIFLQVNFKKNINCRIYINRISNQKRRSITFITKKNLYLWENDTLFKYNSVTCKYSKIYESKKTPLEIECNKFIQTLRNDKYLDKINVALKVLKLVDEVKINS